MLDLDLVGWVVVSLCAIMVGITKTGIPGLGILVVPLMAIAIPARQSVGVLLGILILADLFAIVYHGQDTPVPTQWWFVAGLGFFGWGYDDDGQCSRANNDYLSAGYATAQS